MTTPTHTSNERFGRLLERRDERDFPYYNGEPVEIATWKWLVIILGCAVGFIALTSIPASNNVELLLPRILFPAIMLTVFILLTGRYWSSIFHKPTGGDWLAMVGYGLLTLVVSLVTGAIVAGVFGANSNPATDGLATGGAPEIVAFYVGTGIQLLGEELFTVLPLLALMYLLFTKATLSRRSSIIIAWFVTAAWFGAAHLPTYDWNFIQAFFVIGAARLVLTLAYIRTKNILVSTGAHIINDWLGFTFAIATGALLS